jgi:hypothetical protein
MDNRWVDIEPSQSPLATRWVDIAQVKAASIVETQTRSAGLATRCTVGAYHYHDCADACRYRVSVP